MTLDELETIRLRWALPREDRDRDASDHLACVELLAELITSSRPIPGGLAEKARRLLIGQGVLQVPRIEEEATP